MTGQGSKRSLERRATTANVARSKEYENRASEFGKKIKDVKQQSFLKKVSSIPSVLKSASAVGKSLQKARTGASPEELMKKKSEE